MSSRQITIAQQELVPGQVYEIPLGATVSSSLHLSLPWPPALRSYYRPIVVSCKPSAKTGWKDHFATLGRTKAAKLYRDAVILCVRQALGRFVHAPIYTTPVRIDVELRAPDSRKRDLDNNSKAIMDSLQHANVIKDDFLIDELTLRRGRNKRPGQANVIITALDQPTEPQPQESILDSITTDTDPEEESDPFDIKD